MKQHSLVATLAKVSKQLHKLHINAAKFALAKFVKAHIARAYLAVDVDLLSKCAAQLKLSAQSSYVSNAVT